MKKVIVFGNQKGGTGKSTLAMHLVVSLLEKGYSVATIDVDAKQGTLTRYLENRAQTHKSSPCVLMPKHTVLFENSSDSIHKNEQKNLHDFESLMKSLEKFDYIVIDTPGNDTNLSQIAHSFADVIITPMNESFIDLDLIVRATPKSNNLSTSTYAESVWTQKKNRAQRDKGTIDWIILLNRLSGVESKNQRALEKILSLLSKRLGFRVGKGFKDRVIFKELFLSGLTLIDSNSIKSQTTLSHIAARQELKELLKTLDIT